VVQVGGLKKSLIAAQEVARIMPLMDKVALQGLHFFAVVIVDEDGGYEVVKPRGVDKDAQVYFLRQVLTELERERTTAKQAEGLALPGFNAPN